MKKNVLKRLLGGVIIKKRLTNTVIESKKVVYNIHCSASSFFPFTIFSRDLSKFIHIYFIIF